MLKRLGQHLAHLIDNNIPPGVGFALLLFDIVEPGSTENGFMTWISNAERADMLKALQEMVARFRREELAGATPSDIDDLAKVLAAAHGGAYDRDAMRRVAATAIAMGASPGLARTEGHSS
jgi:hypothetical protein